MTKFEKLSYPTKGTKIEVKDGKPQIPNDPIIPFIEGDGIGPDIWRAAKMVMDGAIAKAYGGKKRIEWFEIYAGEKAAAKYDGRYMPQDTFDAITHFIVAIKGPLTTPVGGGFRSLNVTLRQELDLFACVRPVRYFKGVPSPVRQPEKLDVIIFRENTEDVYAGIEFRQGTEVCDKLIKHLNEDVMPGNKETAKKRIRLDSGIGIKPISITGSNNLQRKAIRWAIARDLPSLTLVHKGNIMKYTEGAFKDWGYEMFVREFRDNVITEDELWDQAKADDGVTPITKEGAFAHLRGGKPAGDRNGRVVIKDRIADSMFQQVLLRPDEYSVISTPNLNGDYLSDACAAQVGGLGMAPGANMGEFVGLFEATHGTAPKYAGKDMVNPGSLILSGVMMLEYLGWDEAAKLVTDGIQKTILQKRVTYDLHRQMEGAVKLKCSEYAAAIVENMG
ncbi:isocitrate dehydrogenase (NADP(+)) [bacterium]|nr:isocitrate dehydrogenase (NADP(+)) [bacterium]